MQNDILIKKEKKVLGKTRLRRFHSQFKLQACIITTFEIFRITYTIYDNNVKVMSKFLCWNLIIQWICGYYHMNEYSKIIGF